LSSLEIRFKATLSKYMPAEALVYCFSLWKENPFHFKIKNGRTTKLGDYRYNPKDRSHTITINNDLNCYAFLVTYLHEVAHLITFKQHGRKVRPHGAEWKNNFKYVALPVLNDAVFPSDVLQSLARYLKNPKASSCSDHNLLKTLSVYDEQPKKFLSDISIGQEFILGQKVFQKVSLRRTRYVCKEVATGRKYLISKSAQVEPSHL